MKLKEKASLSNWLKSYMARHHLTTEELAQKAEIGRGTLNLYLNQNKCPRPGTAIDMAKHLQLDAGERRSFFACFSKSPLSGISEVAIMAELLGEATRGDLSTGAKAELFGEVDETLRLWRQSLLAGVRTAIIPAGGWQSRLLSAELAAQMLDRAVGEALKLELAHVVIVVAARQAKLLNEAAPSNGALKNFKRKISYVTQRGEGLGHAVLTGADELAEDAPFALIFPDEFPDSSCLRTLIACYDQHRCSSVAVWRSSRAERTERGLAFCKQVKGSVANECTITRFEEKPLKIHKDGGGQPWPVLGRYVLTQDAVNALKVCALSPGRLELTAGLEKLLSAHPVMGCLYQGKVHAVPPGTRRKLEEQIAAIDLGPGIRTAR